MKVIVFALVAMVMQWSAGTRLMIVGKSGAIVRRGADLASDVVATLPKGSYAEAAGKEPKKTKQQENAGKSASQKKAEMQVGYSKTAIPTLHSMVNPKL